MRLLRVTLLALACLIASPAGASVDLIGSWYVLIHYRDSSTANPDTDRWEDKMWKFEKKGSRLQWTEYPIVVLTDKTGRFGRVGRNERARMMHAWEPNEGQLLEILAGPQVNSRGSKTKGLRGSPQRGYASTSQSRATSAFTVGYEESWSIDSPTELPVFTRDDSLGTEAALAAGDNGVASGRTRYTALEVTEDGRMIAGTYTRDENKKGVFRLIRSGAARSLETDGLTPNQRQTQNFSEQVRAQARNEAYTQFMQTLGDDNIRALRFAIGEDGLTAIWQRYEPRFIGGDESARTEIRAELYSAYGKGLEKKLAAGFAAGDPMLLLDPKLEGLALDQVDLARDLQATLGAEKISALRKESAARAQAGEAGEEGAAQALRGAILDAYIAEKQAKFTAVIQAANPVTTP